VTRCCVYLGSYDKNFRVKKREERESTGIWVKEGSYWSDQGKNHSWMCVLCWMCGFCRDCYWRTASNNNAKIC